jgi:hypothetical protein
MAGIGIGLVEVYDLASGQPARLANIATRGFVDRGDNVMIGGFIIGGGLGTNGSGSARLLLRAIGQSLGRRRSRERAPGSDTRAGERQRRHDRGKQQLARHPEARNRSHDHPAA